MSIPERPKIYHIVHIDRLPSIVRDGYLYCDAEIGQRPSSGTSIGMTSIKQRRLNKNLSSHPNLRVGDCVPFYFCPRSVMLYLIAKRNHAEMSYTDGQESVVHLEADLHASVDWANRQRQRWAFTLSNAGSNYFEDLANLDKLHKIDWEAVRATHWGGNGAALGVKERKQAEFLVERKFPWELIEQIGILSKDLAYHVYKVLEIGRHRPQIRIRKDWYYV